MRIILLLCAGLLACAQKPSNEIDDLAQEVIKKREGIDIRLTPIDPDKK